MKPAALFTSKNLIGDALYISPALAEWHRQNPGYEIIVETLGDHVMELYSGMPGVEKVVIEKLWPAAGSCFRHTFDVNVAFKLSDKMKIHVAEAYAELLGVKLEPKPKYGHLKPLYTPPPLDVPKHLKNLTLVSMFSNSCTSRERGPDGKLLGKPPNKMLPWPSWKPIIELLEERFGNVKFLGAPTDRADWLKISEEQYLTGVSLPLLARIMAEAKLLVTVDNGMSHLAAAMECPTFLFYPACLGLHYILPRGNPYMNFVHVDPNKMAVDRVIAAMRTALPALVQQKAERHV